MKFSRLRLYLCISLQAVLLLFILTFLPNPILEQLYPKSVLEEISPPLAAADELEDYGGTEESARSRSSTLASTNMSDTSATATSPTPAKTSRASRDGTPSSVTMANSPTAQRNPITSQRPEPQRRSAGTTGPWKVRPATPTKPTAAIPIQAKNFTAEPEWKMEEDYALDSSASETSCPISVKIKALNSSWLKEKFLTRITIFMDDRLFTNHDWVRLGHFIPPYGWMELNYSVVAEVVSALPRIADQQLLLAEKSGDKFPRCVSCAVVGNGGILNASGLGSEIDQHDYVFRVNGAVISGYEKDVGVRTSFYGFTAYTMLASLYLLKKTGFPNIPRDKETKYIHFTEGRRDYEWLNALQKNKEITKGTLEQFRLRPRDDFGDNFDFRRLLVAHPDFMRYLKNRFLKSPTLRQKYWNIYRPSTGALMLLTALHLCDKVSAYGFMTDNFRDYSNYYYDKQKTNITLYANHNFLMERDLWARLHQENIIKLYQRP
ncbi:alpha-N-acetylgalactosaminide alpha-2,6-sialyltransferase 1 [Mantella aurantiaca]